MKKNEIIQSKFTCDYIGTFVCCIHKHVESKLGSLVKGKLREGTALPGTDERFVLWCAFDFEKEESTHLSLIRVGTSGVMSLSTVSLPAEEHFLKLQCLWMGFAISTPAMGRSLLTVVELKGTSQFPVVRKHAELERRDCSEPLELLRSPSELPEAEARPPTSPGGGALSLVRPVSSPPLYKMRGSIS